jgi:hypothetical protein
MSLTVAEVKDILEITSTGHDTAIAALLPLVTAGINEYCGGCFSHQVKEEAVIVSAIGSSGAHTLDHCPVIRNSLYVSSTDQGTRYYGDAYFTDKPIPTYAISSTNIEEYKLDYEGGRIYVPTTESRITSTSNVLVTYSYVDLYGSAKIAASRVIKQNYEMPTGIASESVGSLSRSYTQGTGYDSYVSALLAPYKRPRLI